jgi:hypothetical protein
MKKDKIKVIDPLKQYDELLPMVQQRVDAQLKLIMRNHGFNALTPQEEAIVSGYLAHGNPLKAARDAGIDLAKDTHTQLEQIFTKKHIVEELAIRQAGWHVCRMTTKEWVVSQMVENYQKVKERIDAGAVEVALFAVQAKQLENIAKIQGYISPAVVNKTVNNVAGDAPVLVNINVPQPQEPFVRAIKLAQRQEQFVDV